MLDARIFVLVHKMDLVHEDERDVIFEDRQRIIQAHSRGLSLQCFATSIWDETLYKAWSEIVTNLIPNIQLLKTHLDDFCRISDADEVVLFERATFLVIAHTSQNAAQHNFDTHRFEKISNIVKQFKLSCGKTQAGFQGMEVKNSLFSAFIDAFTENTYIMVIVSDPQIETAATLINIKNAREHFEKNFARS